MRKRNIMFRKAKRTNNINHMRKCRQLRNKVVTIYMLRQERMKYFNALSGASNKTFWKAMKCLYKQRNVIPVLQEDNITAVSDKEKANMLNTFFSRCWNNTDQPMSQAANMTTYGSPPSNLSTNIEDFLCTQEEVSYLLTSQNPEKASGPDNISVRMLKETARSITPSLTRLFNLSITTGIFPRLWKIARVVPIPKNSNKKHPSGYRPISLLPIISI